MKNVNLDLGAESDDKFCVMPAQALIRVPQT